jgi:signal peptidase II
MFPDKKRMAIYISAILFVILDRLFKLLAVNGFFDSPVGIAGDAFKLSFFANYNIAFSLPLGGSFLNVAVAAMIFFLIGLFVRELKRGRLTAACLFAVILGASSNLYDRLKYGYVADYLDLRYFTVFNLADCLIVAGCACVLWIASRTADLRK